MNEAIGWLRGQVEARLLVARSTAAYGSGHWAPTKNDDFDWTIHDAGDVMPREAALADLWGEAPAVFIADNDPQDVIARCEAELAIITRCEAVLEAFASPADRLWPDVTRRERTHSRATVHDIASGYRHRDGYTQHWGEE